jgi:hypothetical protein
LLQPGVGLGRALVDRLQAGGGDADLLKRLGVLGQVADHAGDVVVRGHLQLDHGHDAHGRAVHVRLAAGGRVQREAAAGLVEAALDEARARLPVAGLAAEILEGPHGRRRGR